MNFSERSYNTNIMRPKPLIFHDESKSFLIVVTPWGSQSAGEKVLDHISQFLMTAKQDAELTTPFQSILSLSDEANDLRVATLMANDLIYRTINNEKYELVAETLLLSFNRRHIAWCQMGCPQIILKQKGQVAQPVSLYPETHTGLRNFPMPHQFLGSEPTIAPRCGDLYLNKEDELILLSSSFVPSEIWSLSQSESLENWTDQLVQKDGSQPFWLSRLQVD